MNAFNQIDLDLLRCFYEVASSGSFTQAGEKLYITQSAVSMKLKRLEEIAGRQFIVRNSRKVFLTREGEELLHYARQLISLQNQLTGWLREPNLKGFLRLGMAEHTVQLHLAKMIADFQQLFPEVEIHVEVGLSTPLLAKLHKDLLDIVIAQPDNEQAYNHQLFEEQLVWVAAKGYLPEPEKQLNLALLPEPCLYRTAGLEALKRSGRLYKISITCTSVSGIQNLVAGNLAISVLTKSSVIPSLQVLKQKEGFPKLPKVATYLFMGKSKNNPLSSAFEKYLLEQYNGVKFPTTEELNNLS